MTAIDSKIHEDTVLMEDGPWRLVRHDTRTGQPPRSMLNSYIEHQCHVYKEKRYWYALQLIEQMCDGCRKHPPEEIMGLWKLHNMDYIQRGVSY